MKERDLIAITSLQQVEALLMDTKQMLNEQDLPTHYLLNLFEGVAQLKQDIPMLSDEAFKEQMEGLKEDIHEALVAIKAQKAAL